MENMTTRHANTRLNETSHRRLIINFKSKTVPLICQTVKIETIIWNISTSYEYIMKEKTVTTDFSKIPANSQLGADQKLVKTTILEQDPPLG